MKYNYSIVILLITMFPSMESKKKNQNFNYINITPNDQMEYANNENNTPLFNTNPTTIDSATQYDKNECCIEAMAKGYLAGKEYFFDNGKSIAESMSKVNWKFFDKSFDEIEFSSLSASEISQTLEGVFKIQIPNDHLKCADSYVNGFMRRLYDSGFNSIYTPENSRKILDKIMPILSKYTDR